MSLSLGLALAASVAAAASPERPVETVTVTAQRDTTETAAQGVEVLAGVELAAASVTGGLGESLAGRPGVRSSFFGPNASRPIIRGLGEDRVRVLANGVSGIDASTVSPDHAPAVEGLDADRIEVLKGPAALRYGGNAVGGVVNVIDGRIPRARAEAPMAAKLFVGGSTAEKAGAVAGSATFGSGAWAGRIDAARREAKDYAIPGTVESRRLLEAEGEDPAEAERGIVENTSGEVWVLGGGFGWIGETARLGVSVRRTESNYGIPGHHDHHGEEDGDHEESKSPESFLSGAEDGEEEEGGVRIALDQTRIDLSGALDLSGIFEELTYDLSWADYSHAEIEGSGEIGTVFSSEGFENRLEARHGPIGGFKGLIGAQVGRVDFAAVGEEAFVPPVEITSWGLFAIERYEGQGWGIDAGLRFEGRGYDGIAGDRDFDLVSGSLGAFVTPVDGLRLALTLARTERAPTEIELFADGPHLATAAYELGDSSLKKETALTAEVGARWTLGRAALGLQVWHARFDGFIGFAPTGAEEDGLPVFSATQRDATLSGGEATASLTVFEGAGWRLGGDLALDWTRGRFEGGGALPRIPPSRVTLGVEGSTGAVSARFEVERTDKQSRVSAFELPTDGSTVVNARLSWAPAEANGRLELLLEGRNLGDEEVREHTSYLKDIAPKPGRSIRAALRARF